MDSFNQQIQAPDISKLSDYEKRELQQSLNNELQKAKIQECTLTTLPSPSSISPARVLAFTTHAEKVLFYANMIFLR